MIQNVVVCDKCGTRIAFAGALSEKWAIRFSRESGWSCGKQHLCRECRKKKQEANHAE